MLKVGRVGYFNTLPLFYSMEGFEIIQGHPSQLAQMLREGKIDAGIVSSAEYFFNYQDYFVLPKISISSRRKVCSVLLLSKVPIHEIRSVRITSNSITSKYLLRFLFKNVYRIEPQEVKKGEDAFLTIGDEALELKEVYPFAYDLGEEWFKYTGLPFVFALFLVRKDIPKVHVEQLLREIRLSLRNFFSELSQGMVEFPEEEEDFFKDYFSGCIDYGLGEEHMVSLWRFFRFLEEETGRKSPDTIYLFHP